MKFNSTEHLIVWFRDRYLAGELILKPPFQRQPVWTEKQKNFLVESVLLDLPIPEIYMQHHLETDEDGNDVSRYAVVDGQQRIRSILQFIGVDREESELDFNKFGLDKLPGDAEFSGASYAGFAPEQRKQFLQYKFSVRQLENADDESVRNLFKRLNKYSTRLNEQELRNATYTGPFMKKAVEFADDEFWVTHRLVSPAQIRRMKDVEFVSELMIGLLHGPQGGSGKNIDVFYAQYEDYDDEFPDQPILVSRFNQTKLVIQAISDYDIGERFGRNKTDFYSLFLAIGSFVPSSKISDPAGAAAALRDFAGKVNNRLQAGSAKVGSNVVSYVSAVEKGANDKARRASRHSVLVALMSPFFSAPASKKVAAKKSSAFKA